MGGGGWYMGSGCGGVEMGWWFGGERECGEVFGTRWGGAKERIAERREVGHRRAHLIICG